MLIAAALMAVAAFATAGPAAADDRAQAAAVMRSLDRLAAQRASLTLRLDSAQAHLGQLTRALAAARTQERIDRRNLEATRGVLARALVNQYKSTGSDPAMFLFSAGSFADMVDRIDILNRVGATEAGAILAIARASAHVRADAAETERRQAAVSAQVAALGRERASVDGTIASRQQLLASINARIRARIAAEQRRRSRLARATSAPSAPAVTSGGGSQDTSGGATSSAFTGDVTWYGPGFAGQPTASGEPFDPTKLTAASPWLPFDTMLRVTSTVTGRSVVVRVNDRGPFGHGVLDLSAHAARIIGLQGWQRCRIVVLS